MRSRKWLCVGVLSLAFFLIAVPLAMAQTEATKVPVAASLRYPVKFVCGAIGAEGPPDAFLPLPRGRYHTAINVHNPSLTAKVVFAKKVAVSGIVPPTGGGGTEQISSCFSQQPGPVTDFFKAELGAMQSFEIDCQDVYSMLEYSTGAPSDLEQWLLKGFVVIMSPVELDVTAVYSARPTGGGGDGPPPPDFAQVSSMDTEVIQPKPQRAAISAVVPQAIPD